MELGDRIADVDVEGEHQYVLAEQLDEIAEMEPTGEVRLVGGFDQAVLGPTTRDIHMLDATRRSAVSRAAGWIAPVVLRDGRVCGTWEIRGEALAVEWFREKGAVPDRALRDEADRIGTLVKAAVTLNVAVV
jgi:hypothetical protein